MKTVGFTVLLLTAVMTVPARSQTVTGTVIDTASNTRVAAAQVILLQVDTSYTITTDSTGKFRFRARPGIFRLHIRALGYSELQSEVLNLTEKENLSVLAFLTVTPVEVMPVYVIARSHRGLSSIEEFQDRMKKGSRTGFGYFIDEKKIANMPAFYTTDILKRIPGARVGRDRVSLRWECSDAIYFVDGVQVRGIGQVHELVPAETATEVVNSLVSPSDIAGIEVYKGIGGLPAQFMTMTEGSACGVIAIWTKR